MGSLLHRTAGNATRVAAGALALYGAVFIARLVSPDASNGLAFLYVLPVVMIAIEFGLAAGLFAAAASVGLVGAWDLLSSQDISFVGT